MAQGDGPFHWADRVYMIHVITDRSAIQLFTFAPSKYRFFYASKRFVAQLMLCISTKEDNFSMTDEESGQI